MVTAKRIPVPEPIAPKKSAITDSPPIQRPPKAAAVGMYLQRPGQYEHTGNDLKDGTRHILLKQWKSVFQSSWYLLSSCTIDVSLCPLMTICCSFSCFATWGETRTVNMTWGWRGRGELKNKLTSLAEDPDTSIHVLEKKAQEPSMKTM